jgi:hypothetical protein
MSLQLENPIALTSNSLKFGPLPGIHNVIYDSNIILIVYESNDTRMLVMDLFNGNRLISKHQL